MAWKFNIMHLECLVCFDAEYFFSIKNYLLQIKVKVCLKS